MHNKLISLSHLLHFMDPELHRTFTSLGLSDMPFAHRWLHLAFKRDFSFDQVRMLYTVAEELTWRQPGHVPL
jgi:TBC1 domain family member 15